MNCVVVDMGIGAIRCGYSTDDAPRHIVPNVVGHHRSSGTSTNITSSSVRVGREAQQLRQFLDLNTPVNLNGIITSWGDMEALWKHLFGTLLRTKPGLFSLIVTESARNPRALREKVVEIMFEEFRFSRFMVISRPVAVCVFYGVQSGLVVELGHQSTRCIPVHRNKVMTDWASSVELGGFHLAKYMSRLLAERGIKLEVSSSLEVLLHIIQNHCYVGEEGSETHVTVETSKTITVPDGSQFCIAHELFRCPELYFDPRLDGLTCEPLDRLVIGTLNKCDGKTLLDVRNNILLSGGTSVLPSLGDRLQNLLRSYFHADGLSVKVHPGSEHAAWKGASTAADSSAFDSCWMSEKQFRELGAAAIHDKMTGSSKRPSSFSS